MPKFTIYYKAPYDYIEYKMDADNTKQLLFILNMLEGEHCYNIRIEVNRRL